MPVTADEARVKSVAARIQRLAAAEEARRMEEAERVRKLKRVENELVPQCLRYIDELIIAAANREETSCVCKGAERITGRTDTTLQDLLENLIVMDLRNRGFEVSTALNCGPTIQVTHIKISWEKADTKDQTDKSPNANHER